MTTTNKIVHMTAEEYEAWNARIVSGRTVMTDKERATRLCAAVRELNDYVNESRDAGLRVDLSVADGPRVYGARSMDDVTQVTVRVYRPVVAARASPPSPREAANRYFVPIDEEARDGKKRLLRFPGGDEHVGYWSANNERWYSGKDDLAFGDAPTHYDRRVVP